MFGIPTFFATSESINKAKHTPDR
ncbi:hypothetical protein EYZ11_005687 [Aspergillus tanneri]|uniref:Uncharacterized protein n=1 Tax=Aspergillus tanneri TaxID=1220188 RepID=A0A4S3JHV6_9EURO|nr:hypothetical protein EYZ11_005687 [Aspergillus tanneri]